MNLTAVGARSVVHVGAATAASEPRGDGAPCPPLPLLSAPPGYAAGPLEVLREVSRLELVLGDAIASADPQTLMLMLAARIRRSQNESATTALSANRAQSRARFEAQCEAFRRAEEAQGNGDFWSTVARAATYVVSAATIAVGLASSVFTGGASVIAAVAVVASIVASTGTIGVMAAQDLGVMRDRPEWLSIGLGVLSMLGGLGGFVQGGVVAAVGATTTLLAQAANVGADVLVATGAMSEPGPEFRWTMAALGLLGAGLSVGGALTSSAGSTAGSARTNPDLSRLNATARVIQGGGQVVQGAAGGVHAAFRHDHDVAESDATSERRGIERLQRRAEAVLEAVQQALETYGRAVRRATTCGEEAHGARLQIARNMARA